MPSTTSTFIPERKVRVSTPTAVLDALLGMPLRPKGLVVIPNGSGTPTYIEGNRRVAEALRSAGFATLVIDLLDRHEVAQDAETSTLRFDLPLLASRLLGAVSWASHHPTLAKLPVALFASGTCAAAALAAAARDGDRRIAAVVSRAGRPELARLTLGAVRAPTLLLVGELDTANLVANRDVLPLLPRGSRVRVVNGARHALEEPAEIEEVSTATVGWFERAFAGAPAVPSDVAMSLAR